MKKSPRKSRQATSAGARAARCRNLYRFIRVRMGVELSDRELARRWGMEWKSFSALKHGQRQVPRIDELERLAAILGVEPAAVFEVARGVDAAEVAATLGRAAAGTAQRQRGDERQRLRALFDQLPAACVLYGADRRVVAANPAIARVAPAQAEEALGRTAAELFGEVAPPACPVTRAFSTGGVEQQVSAARNANGAAVLVHRTVGPIVANGRVAQAIEVIVDVTAQVRAGALRVLSLGRAPREARGRERRELRFDVALEAELRHAGAAERVPVEDLGPGGMFVRTRRRIAPGTTVELSWRLPGDDARVEARAVVVWRRERGARAGLGVRFVDVAPPLDPTGLGRAAS